MTLERDVLAEGEPRLTSHSPRRGVMLDELPRLSFHQLMFARDLPVNARESWLHAGEAAATEPRAGMSYERGVRALEALRRCIVPNT